MGEEENEAAATAAAAGGRREERNVFDLTPRRAFAPREMSACNTRGDTHRATRTTYARGEKRSVSRKNDGGGIDNYY